MSTVLTNGIIIPDNGSRNWGGDLANNWNILDVNVGYMTDVKNRVTTLENSTAENTANIQTNASNISALQTSKQDALSEQQIANIADVTNKANDADVVHKSGNETVAGTKLFTIAPISANSATTNGFFIRNNAIARNEVPSQFYHSSFRVYDKNDHVFGEYCVEKSTSGFSLLNMNVRSENSDGTEISRGLFLTLSNDASVVSFRPSTNNEFNLGTSSNKWKTINGVNPGALSLPDYSQSVDVTSLVVNNDGVFQYTNNLYDGYLVITAFADNVRVSNQGFECRAVKSIDDAVTTHIAAKLNETVYMSFTNFTNFAYVNLYKCSGNV